MRTYPELYFGYGTMKTLRSSPLKKREVLKVCMYATDIFREVTIPHLQSCTVGKSFE